jgi:hypothetical protein
MIQRVWGILAAVVLAAVLAEAVGNVAEPWADGLAGVLVGAVGAASLRARPRYGIVVLGVAALWFASTVRPEMSPLSRAALVAMAFTFPDGWLHRRALMVLVPAGAVVAALPPSVGGVSVALALCGLTSAASVVEARPTSNGAALDGRARALSGVFLAGAFLLPFLAAHGVELLANVPGAADMAFSLLVGCSAVVLLVRLITTSGDVEADSVIALSERDAGAALRLLRDQPWTSVAVERGAMAAAIRMLERNEELQRELAQTVEEVRASRLRLLEATTVERRDLEGRLRVRARPMVDRTRALVGSLSLAGAAMATLGDCIRQLDGIEVDLDAVGRGLHPPGLSDRGLPSLIDLAPGCPIPVTITVPEHRYAQPIEVAVWYACSEGLTNLVKHAGASCASIALVEAQGCLVATVSDDGHGGARLAEGGGLAGLRDRLAAVEGSLEVASAPGGTTLTMRVPLP